MAVSMQSLKANFPDASIAVVGVAAQQPRQWQMQVGKRWMRSSPIGVRSLTAALRCRRSTDAAKMESWVGTKTGFLRDCRFVRHGCHHAR